MTELSCVIFDVDGTLIDSQAHILASMAGAFAAVDLPTPSREATLSIVGLSLPQAMMRLAPDHLDLNETLVAAYKDTFATLRQSGDGAALSPLFPGARDVIDALSVRDEVFLAVATGKSRRGLDHVIDLHDLDGVFHSLQVADDHPSKPHPSMVEACLADTGVAPGRAVMIGDTTYDIEMAGAAGCAAVGVSWGYHPVADLRAAGAARVIDRFADLIPTLEQILGTE